jgi:hypothetical protein
MPQVDGTLSGVRPAVTVPVGAQRCENELPQSVHNMNFKTMTGVFLCVQADS